jgi:mono/diheme cytochrome c family protein
LENGEWIRDSTEFRGQWGLSHDDEGRLIYNYNWSQLHGDLVPPNYLSSNQNHTSTTGIDYGLTTDRRIYPIRPNPAVNRGYVTGTLDDKGRLQEFTAACSPFFYRGNALPKQYYGSVFVCEPSGNLIKRNGVTENGYYVTAYDPTPGEEFLASTDERFRPVSFASGPDGALYVADMYRGLIQHGKYITEYLREQTLSRKLDQPVHCGRIWRVTPKKWKPSKPETLSTATTNKLIENLSSSNGWTRDISQQLLIERKDSNSIKLLEYTVLDNPNSFARFHALWTLYGMHELKGGDWPLHAVDDTSLLVSANAFRLLELVSETDVVVQLKMEIAMFEKIKTSDDKLALQIALSSRAISPQRKIDLLTTIANRYDSSALMRDVILSGLQNYEYPFLDKLLSLPNWNSKQPGREILIEMLTSAIIRKGNPNELTSLLNQVRSNPNQWQTNSILMALSTQIKKGFKPVSIKVKPEKLIKEFKNDSVITSMIELLFKWPGHNPVKPQVHKNNLSDAELVRFANGRQQYLSACAGCHGTNGEGVPRFAPTLVQSEWVLNDERKLSLVILHGIEGPIDVNGKHYDVPSILPIMPAHTPLDDGTIANILTYIRNAWGNSAPAVSPRTVGLTRNRSQGRVQPWTTKELDEYLKSIENQN